MIFNPIADINAAQQTQAFTVNPISNGLSESTVSFNGVAVKAVESKTSGTGIDMQASRFELSEFGLASMPANTASIDAFAQTLSLPVPAQQNEKPSVEMISSIVASKDEMVSTTMMNLYSGSGASKLENENGAKFLYSNQDLNDLKYSKDEDAALRQVSAQFEAVFVQQMLKGMRSATQAMADEDNPMSQSKDNMFQDMLDNQLATSITGKSGFGLADSLYAQLSKVRG